MRQINSKMDINDSKVKKIKSRQFKCEKCTRIYASQSALNEHMRKLHSNDPKWLKCEFCNYESLFKEAIKAHLLRKHLSEDEKRKKWHQCHHCDYQNPKRSGLLRHEFNVHSSKEKVDWFQCDHCNYKTAVKAYMNKHKAEHSTKSQIQRPDEPKTLYTCAIPLKINLKVTKYDLRLKKSRKCEYCPFRGISKLLFLKHSCNRKSKQLNCQKCPQVFVSKCALKTHIRELHSHNKKWIKCESCNYITLNKDNYKSHMLRKHIIEEKPKKWFHCDYQNPVRSTVSQHEFLIHSAKDEHDCNFCNYKTTENFKPKPQDHKKRTILQHDQPSNFYNCSIPLKIKPKVAEYYIKCNVAVDSIRYKKCDYCSFRAVSNLLFLRHSCVRTPIHSHCEECDRVFTSRRNLHYHIRMLHAENKKWRKCTFCSYKTVLKHSFEIHVRRKHISEEDKQKTWFRCDHCDYKNAVKASVEKHTFNKHSLDWLTCDHCNYKTKVEINLEKHRKLRHSHNNIKWYQCEFCDHQTLYKNGLERHITRKHFRCITYQNQRNSPKWHKCEYCDYQSVVKSNYKRHVLTKHTKHSRQSSNTLKDKIWYRCEQCDYQSVVKSNYKRHMLCKHTPKDDVHRFDCSLCEYKTPIQDNLKKHMARNHSHVIEHLGQLSEEPQNCSSETTKKTTKTVDSDDKKIFKCNFCDYKASRNSAVNYHISREHT